MSGTTTTTTILRPAPAVPTTTSVTLSPGSSITVQRSAGGQQQQPQQQQQRSVQFDTPENEYTRAINFQPQQAQQQQQEPIYDEVAGDEVRPGRNVRSRRNTSTTGGNRGAGGSDDPDDSQVRVGPNGLPYCEEKPGMGSRFKSAWERVRASDDGSRFVFPAIAALVAIVLFVIVVFMTGPALVKIGALALVVAFVVYTYRQCRAVMATLF